MRDTIPVSEELLSLLSELLQPAEQAVYIAAKLVMVKDRKMPTISRLEPLVGKNVGAIIKRMKTKGLLPKGRLDFLPLDQKFMAISQGEKAEKPTMPNEPEQEVDERARALVAELKTQLKAKLPNSWFAIQRRVTLSMLMVDKIEFEEILACIQWIFSDDWASHWLAPHCTTMGKVRQYLVTYRTRAASGKAIREGQKRENQKGHETEWNEAATGTTSR
jgi:hypothetical protein